MDLSARPAAAGVGEARACFLDLPPSLVCAIVEEVCGRRKGCFDHALVCREFLHHSVEGHKALVVREGAKIPKDALLISIRQFPNLTSICLQRNSGWILSLDQVARSLGPKMLSFSAPCSRGDTRRTWSFFSSFARPGCACWTNGCQANAFSIMADNCRDLEALHLGGVRLGSSASPFLPSISRLTSLKHLHLIAWSWESFQKAPPLSQVDMENDWPRLHSAAILSYITCLVNLESLAIESRVTHLPPSISALSLLTQLSLVADVLVSLSRVASLTSLRAFMLQSNALEEVPEEFMALSKLKHLVLYCPLLTTMPDHFHPLRNLKTLVARMDWDPIPQSLACLQHLTLFAIDRLRSPADLPRFLPRFTNLQVLGVREDAVPNLVSRGMGVAAACPLQFPKLNVLHVCGSPPADAKPLTKLLRTLPALEELLVRVGTSSRGLPSDIGALRRLRVLVVLCGSVPLILPRALGELTNLEELQVRSQGNPDDACTVSFPHSVSRLVRLQRLRVQGFSNLSFTHHRFGLRACEALDSICSLVGLKMLKLSYIKGEFSLPLAVSRLSNLDMLKISYCPHFKVLPPTVSCITTLRVFKIVDCRSVELPSSLTTMSSLRDLSISGSAPDAWLRQHADAILALPKLNWASKAALPETDQYF